MICLPNPMFVASRLICAPSGARPFDRRSNGRWCTLYVFKCFSLCVHYRVDFCFSRQINDLTVTVFPVLLLHFCVVFKKKTLDLWSCGCDENTVIEFEPSDSSDGPDLSSAELILFYLFPLFFFTYLHYNFYFLIYISLAFKVCYCLFVFTLFFISFNLLVYYLMVFYFVTTLFNLCLKLLHAYLILVTHFY